MPICELFEGRAAHHFQNFVMRIFVTLLLFFLTDEVFLFTYFDSIWCFVIATWSHFYMYIMLWHLIFSKVSCPFGPYGDMLG